MFGSFVYDKQNVCDITHNKEYTLISFMGTVMPEVSMCVCKFHRKSISWQRLLFVPR